jgi:hypothetical protein
VIERTAPPGALGLNLLRMPQSPEPNRLTPGKATTTLLYLLVLGDLMFIAIHVLHVWSPWLPAYSLSIEADRGLAELFQYAKQLGLVACLGFVFFRTRGWAFAGWASFFALLLLDDAFALHERLGSMLGVRLGFPEMFGLRQDDFGEIAIGGMLGLCAVAMVALALRRGGATARRISQDFLCLLVLLAVFAVLIDALHTITYFRAPTIAPLFALIEDGGEMIVVSCMTAYGFAILNNAGRRRVAIWPWVRERLPAFARA